MATERLTAILWRVGWWLMMPVGIALLLFYVMRWLVSPQFRKQLGVDPYGRADDPHWFFSGYRGWMKNHPLLRRSGEGMWWDTPDGKAPIDRWTWDQPQRREMQILGLG